jgi:G3E family GTPase
MVERYLMGNTPLYLITGFLGSGKTTFVQRVIEHFAGSKKIAVVQNEFAPANFDGKELKRNTNSAFDLLEINNGSVFCVCLLSGFIDSLYQFTTQYKPDLLLMEASGLSDPVSIGQIFNSPKLQEIVYLAGTICIVDARNMGKFDKLLTRIHHQLQIADYILMNKTDLIENSGEIQQLINSINPFAQKYLTNHCNVPIDELFSGKTIHQKKLFFMPADSSRPDIHAVVFRSAKALKEENLPTFLQQLTSKTIRLKGHILLDNNTSIAVQAIADELHTQIIPLKTRQTELIAMGYEISMQELKDCYQRNA